MERLIIESAVEFGILIYDKEVPVDTVASVLREVKLEELLSVFEYENSKLTPKVSVSFSDFAERYGLLPKMMVSQGKAFGDWFRVTYESTEFLPPESSGSDDIRVGESSIERMDYVHPGKLEALIRGLERAGYSKGSLEVKVGKVTESWGKLPYCCVTLSDVGKMIVFSEEKRRGTYVLEIDADLSLSKSSYGENMIGYSERKPYIFELLLLEQIAPEKFEKFILEKHEMIKSKYTAKEFLELEIAQIEELFDCDLSLAQYARFILKIDIDSTFGIEQKMSMAAMIWPDLDIRSMENMEDEEIIEVLKGVYPEVLDMVFSSIENRTIPIYNGYTLQNIATRLGCEIRVNRWEGIWELAEEVFGVSLEEWPEMVRAEYKIKYTKDRFLRMPVKDVSKFTIFDGKFGAKSAYSLAFGEYISYFGVKEKKLLADWIWEG